MHTKKTEISHKLTQVKTGLNDWMTLLRQYAIYAVKNIECFGAKFSLQEVITLAEKWNLSHGSSTQVLQTSKRNCDRTDFFK